MRTQIEQFSAKRSSRCPSFAQGGVVGDSIFKIKLHRKAFFEGLSDMIDSSGIFNQQEIQILLGGVNAPINYDDLRKHTNYVGLYDNNEETIVASGIGDGPAALLEEAIGGEDRIGFAVGAGEAILALEVAIVDGDDRRVVAGGLDNNLGIVEGGVRAEVVVFEDGTEHFLLRLGSGNGDDRVQIEQRVVVLRCQCQYVFARVRRE
ncbi:hypothetical protein D9615_006315 [Tricholomella constricta]|uniref:HECT domain-containing protein n=1 Tax=Tricholomella constricta TaxID=117010 RepID=A0A8H5HB32_9AGAR|nr:hypothetical protein D9615_006315 [Tricholomella constricta]